MPASRRHQHRLTAAEATELVAARLDGAQIRELASRFGVDRATVEAHLRRQGVPLQRYLGRTLTPDELIGAGQLYASGLSLVAVGERFGVDKRYLSRVLPGIGVLVRRPGQQKRL